jgi:hypothetical protein
MSAGLPNRAEVLLKIKAMRVATESREAVAAWAMTIIDDDSVEATDSVVWKVLKNLGAVDMPGIDRPYLYAEEDFAGWESNLN